MGMIINPYRFGDGEVATYISGLATPLSSGQIALLNTFVGSLKSGLSISALSEVFDVMYILAGETEESSLRNLIRRANDATTSGSPTFAALEGFTGATNKYINTNYNPATQGINYTQNNASIGLYSRTAKAELSGETSISDGTSASQLTLSYSNRCYAQINQSNDTLVEYNSNGATSGLFITTRNGSAANTISIYKNKTTAGSGGGTTASSSVISLNFYVCCQNINNTPSYFSTKQLSLFFAGKYITTAMRDVIVDAFEAYMDANGKGVIT